MIGQGRWGHVTVGTLKGRTRGREALDRLLYSHNHRSMSLRTLVNSFSRLSVAGPSKSPACCSSLVSTVVDSRLSASLASIRSQQRRLLSTTRPVQATLNQVTRGARKPIKRQARTPALQGSYQKKGVCSKVYTTKPKKPNSAVRKVAKVKLSTGRAIIAYIPGEGHNLQEHSVVLVRGGRTQDLPGAKSV